jgi:O-antigen ligase
MKEWTSNMLAHDSNHMSGSHKASSRRTWLLPAFVSCATAGLLLALPAGLLSWQAVVVVIGLTAVLVSLWFVLSSSREREMWTEKTLLLTWWLLLVSEEVFDPFVLPKFGVEAAENAFAGRFTIAAYGELALWVLAGLISLLCVWRRWEYVQGLWTKPYRWVVLFGLLCLGSALYTPKPLFALAWALKLLVVMASASSLRSSQRIASFFRSTLWGFLVLSAAPLAVALINPTYGEDGRLANIAPDGLSATAGTLLLLSLMLYSITRKRWFLVTSVVGLAVMTFAGGKTAIVAGILCGLLYFVLQGRLSSAVTLTAAVAAIGAFILAFTPLASHFSWYFSSGQLGTISGRANLWRTVAPAIWQRPLVGHGYLASRFVALQIENVPFGAPHMHNGFLEVMYNQGLIGLILIVIIHLAIVRNLFKAFRLRNTSGGMHLFAIGSIVLYLNLLINGMFNASFGGRAEAPFMLLLALVVISDRLVKIPEERVPGRVRMTVNPAIDYRPVHSQV